jgi:mannose-6-phosphate isomerase-like protein (cupin superfamily)
MPAVPQDTAELSDILVRRSDGEPITDLEHRKAILLAAREQITVTWYHLVPGERGPDPHVHHEHVDSFYVLDGELGFILGPDREHVRIGAGGLVAAPPTFVHTFVNSSDSEVRFLNIHTPDGGFADYMRGRRDGDEGATFDTADPPEDGGLPMSEGIVAGPGEGERFERGGNQIVLLKGVLSELCVAEFELSGPFEGPHLHQHDAQVDNFYVIDGEVEMTIEGDQYVARPETLASIPPGVDHTFNRPGTGHTRVLNIHAPDGGFGDFLRGASV